MFFKNMFLLFYYKNVLLSRSLDREKYVVDLITCYKMNDYGNKKFTPKTVPINIHQKM